MFMEEYAKQGEQGLERFTADINTKLQSGFITEETAQRLREDFEQMQSAEKMKAELTEAANLFAATLKNPSQYTGLGNIIYAQIYADIAALNRT
jgi:hypothetical protein